MNASKTVLALLALLTAFVVSAQDWRIQPVPLSTRWAASVDPSNPWPEYPRPQMVRSNWQNLNGLWEYAITPAAATAPEQYVGRILVPYPLESALSGVKKSLQPDQLLWYRRTIDFKPGPAGERVLLHFGAVDYEATAYVNDKKLGTHSGGYQNFAFDITDALKAGDNQLVVKVHDPTDRGANPTGKQSLDAQWMYYSASSGIWQTVWLERVPSTYIEALKLTPDVDRSELRVEVTLNGRQEGHAIEAIASSGDKVVARQVVTRAAALRIEQPRLWSPDDSYLYDLEVRVLKDGRVVDAVKSYFGLRKIELKTDAQGRARIHLNNAYTFNLGVVDQGYWPEGLYAAPSDAALKFDIQTAKALGFNTVRKHLKVEPQRWYYHCDRLGLLVWQDMPMAYNDSPQARAQFEREVQQNLSQLHNHPSITMWVLFNEGWGAYEQKRLAHSMKQADPSRLVNGHSGPYDQTEHAQWLKRQPSSRLLWPLGTPGPSFAEFQDLQYGAPADWIAGDVVDLHYYPGPKMFPAREDAASVTGEHGSFGVYIEGHAWNELKLVGLGLGGWRLTPQQLLQAHTESTAKLKTLEAEGLSGSTYFQIVDVESEQQGFLTYDRAVAKVPVAEIERLNAKLVPRAKNYAQATEGYSVADADPTPEPKRYEMLVAEFRAGRRDAMFLQRLALTAIRQKDTAQATAAGDAFIEHASRPYTREFWQALLAITQTSKDEGFKLLRGKAPEVNAMLGAHEAEKKLLEVIQRELITPYFKDSQRKQSWKDFEASVATEHGDLGREAVYGVQMMDALKREDWVSFGNSYARYYETATPRSLYQVHSLAYQVLKHVSDTRVLQRAIQVMKWQLDSPRESPIFGRYDPTELDTYANLLDKVGRTAEAIDWQQKAVALTDGRDPEIVANLERMKASLQSSLRN